MGGYGLPVVPHVEGREADVETHVEAEGPVRSLLCVLRRGPEVEEERTLRASVAIPPGPPPRLPSTPLRVRGVSLRRKFTSGVWYTSLPSRPKFNTGTVDGGDYDTFSS